MAMSKNCVKRNPTGIRFKNRKVNQKTEVSLSQNASKGKNGKRSNVYPGSLTEDTLARVDSKREFKLFTLYLDRDNNLYLETKSHTAKKLKFNRFKMGALKGSNFEFNDSLVTETIEGMPIIQIVGYITSRTVNELLKICCEYCQSIAE